MFKGALILSTYCRLKANSLRLTTERAGRGHDWLVDTQPADSRSTTIGMVLGRDVTSSVQVSIEMISTLPTDEYALRTAVGASTMPAAATCLRGMPGVNPSHRTTPFLGLVRDKALELGERPGVHSALGGRAPLGLHPLTNVLEVFQNDRPAWLDGLNDLLGEHMIAVVAEAPLSVAYTFEMSFRAARAFLLQRSLEMKQSAFDCLPALLTQETVVRRDSRARDAQIDADNLIGRRNVWSKNRDDDVQPPPAITLNQIGGIGRIARILGAVIGNMKTDRLSPADERHPHRAALPIHAVGMQVVTRWAGLRVRPRDLPTRFLERKRAFHRFGRLDARLHVQIAHEGRILSLERVVQRAMQFDTIFLVLLPAVGTHGVEHRRKLAAGFGKCVGLGWRRFKMYAYCALHMKSIPYITLFRK